MATQAGARDRVQPPTGACSPALAATGRCGCGSTRARARGLLVCVRSGVRVLALAVHDRTIAIGLRRALAPQTP